MTTLILIPCTDRKRIRPPERLRARTLARAPVSDLASTWTRRIASASVSLSHCDIYCGRAYQEAIKATRLQSSELIVVSAGLGLVRPNRAIPSYSLTVAPGHPDSISRRVSCGQFSPAAWWSALKASCKESGGLDELIRESSPTLVLLSLSANYARLIYDDLEKLSDHEARRVRIFGSGIDKHLPPSLIRSVMPYDARLNGPDSLVSGTMSDFGSRALHHFAKCRASGDIEGVDPENDHAALTRLMDPWGFPVVPTRERMSDEAIVQFILDNWVATRGRSGASLRLLRDSGFACEQGRFRDLFKSASEPHIGLVESAV